MRTHFYDEQSDIDWLFQVHLQAWDNSPTHTATRCAVLHGNEDAPERIELFADNHYQAVPVVFIQSPETGNMIREDL